MTTTYQEKILQFENYAFLIELLPKQENIFVFE